MADTAEDGEEGEEEEEEEEAGEEEADIHTVNMEAVELVDQAVDIHSHMPNLSVPATAAVGVQGAGAGGRVSRARAASQGADPLDTENHFLTLLNVQLWITATLAAS